MEKSRIFIEKDFGKKGNLDKAYIISLGYYGSKDKMAKRKMHYPNSQINVGTAERARMTPVKIVELQQLEKPVSSSLLEKQ